ncbi:MAG: SEC59/DGK1/VTE5 family protein [Candidatus Marinimicrobia bacterium]|nr:SEC59/DGK1/VTE5 family protein [Candidatus Neomarinimicrobiota bacterium]
MYNIPKAELGRKTIHYTAVLIPLIYYFFLEKDPAAIILLIISIGMLIAEVLRMTVPFCRSLYMRLFGDMTRPHEHANHLTGATYLFIGSLLVVYLFPKDIAVVAMLFNMVGDPTACLVGMAFGKIKLSRSKTLEGTLAFIIASLIVTWWIPGAPLHVKLIGAVVAGGLEHITWRLDDNLVIPSVSALVMYFLI